MFVLGVTGGIGCGKSTAASRMRDRGIPVLDADQISHQVSAAGGRAESEIIESFGTEILGEDGAIDRGLLAELVFHDRRALDRLSLIVHAAVMDEIKQSLQILEAKKTKAVVLDVPIPVRDGFLDRCDLVLLIWASDEVRIPRLRERGLNDEQIKERIAMQMSHEEYQEIANLEILNDGDLDELYAKVDRLLEDELASRGIRLQAPPDIS
ncbi:MAG: dephospho-CoA kinase [Eubacteriales bacterium]|nr:dephospho-CoA kinase [Eubacteriales bacterium]